MKNKKTMMVVAGILVAVLVAGGLLILSRGSKPAAPENNQRQEQPADTIPTVDASVKVDLSQATGGKEVNLAVSGIPSGTESIDYELSYNTKSQGLQGVIGSAKVGGEQDFSKQITLGTCSSGRCVYHEVVGKVKLSLRFGGSYGEKIFDKEYQL